MVIMMLTVSVSAVTVSVVDTLRHDTVAVLPNQEVSDTLRYVPKKKWFSKVVSAIGGLLAPERDSTYIDLLPQYNWSAEAQITQRFEQYALTSGDNLSVKASPRVRTCFGPFFGWRWVFLGYNFDINSLFLNNDDTDISASIYSPAFGLDLFHRRVGGSYYLHELKYQGIDYTNLIKGKAFDGIRNGMTRVSFYYIFNHKRYSHQAAFNQTNRQIKSAGSPIAGLAYAHNRVSIDWEKLGELIEPEYDSYEDTEGLFNWQKNDEISLIGGYAYSWVFAKNWLAAGEVMGSVGYLVNNLGKSEKPEIGGKTLSRTKNIAFNGNARIALLYNNGPWFAGTQGVFFYYRYGNGRITNRDLLGCIYVYVGCNF